jgi:Family of unknown function (DUF6445)
VQINPHARVRVELVAHSIPVLYVDDFYSDPMEVREEGLRGSFDRTVAMYPGRHTPLNTEASQRVLHHVCRLLTLLGERIYEPATATTDFSILTTKAKDLLNAQKHPHIDPTPVLGLVYLNPHLTQGTCFFYNRILGTHTIVGDEQLKKLGDFMSNESHKYEPTNYAVDDSAAWQKIYTIEGLFNRLVVYPGNVFHSIDVSDVPEKVPVSEARLTQRIIVQDTRPKTPPAGTAA